MSVHSDNDYAQCHVCISVYTCIWVLDYRCLIFSSVNRGQSFLDAAQHEKMMEREALSSGRVYDQMVEMMQVCTVHTHVPGEELSVKTVHVCMYM